MLRASRLASIVTLTGAVIMALEILSSRVLAPHFGNSVYVWGSIISVFLAALAAGYWWGGRLADRRPRLEVLGLLITGAAVWQGLLLVAGTRAAGVLGDFTGNTPGGTLLAATLLFGPPSLLLATVSPFAIRLAARDIAGLGDTAGRLFAVSTGGSLAGTLACTFLLIPLFELERILSLLLFTTALAALLTLRRGHLRLTRLAPPIGLAIIGLTGLLARPAEPGPLLRTRMTPYQTLQVTEVAGVRYLRSDRVLQSAVRLADGQPALSYLRHAPAVLLLDPEPDRLLAIGMGSGVVARYLRLARPALEADYVELDPAIPELATELLGFRGGPADRVHVADGRRFLTSSEERWDLIYCDTYIGLAVPFHLATTEFFEVVRGHLAPGGVFAMNLASSPEDPFVRAVLRTLSQRFPTLYVFQVAGSANLLVLARDATATLTDAVLAERAAELDARLDYSPTLADIASRRLELEIDPRRDLLLTDAYAPANHLVQLGQRTLELP